MSRKTLQRILGALALAAVLGAAAPAEAGGFKPESFSTDLWARVWSWVTEGWWSGAEGSRSRAVVRDKAHATIDPDGTPATGGSNPPPPIDPQSSGDAHPTIDPNG